MKSVYLSVIIIITTITIVGCGSITRTETDVFSDVKRDTTVITQNVNHPGNRDNGVIYPSSKVVQIEHDVNMQNYEVERHYPNFIRFGLFEGVGLIGSSSKNKIGAGLFGVFPDFANLRDDFRGTDSKFFSGGLYRLGIFEWRLRWFKDSQDWTYGFSGMEFILPNAKGEEVLVGIAPLYIRKRYFIKSDIPYITFTPSVGISLFPSQYLNLSGSLDIGSIGGLNFRTYLGLALGYNSVSSPQIKNNDFTNEAQYPVIPYFGIGISVLDFHLGTVVHEDLIHWHRVRSQVSRSLDDHYLGKMLLDPLYQHRRVSIHHHPADFGGLQQGIEYVLVQWLTRQRAVILARHPHRVMAHWHQSDNGWFWLGHFTSLLHTHIFIHPPPCSGWAEHCAGQPPQPPSRSSWDNKRFASIARLTDPTGGNPGKFPKTASAGSEGCSPIHGRALFRQSQCASRSTHCPTRGVKSH